MGELGLNKIFGALLAAALLIMGLREVSTSIFGGGGHYHKEHESLNDWAEHSFSYFVDIAESGGGGDEVEEIYDLGLLLASADIGAGERSFKGKCATCHTIEQGGAQGTGPNLYGILGAQKNAVGAFGAYSGALQASEGGWSYENMDAWLLAPARYARGTSMAFAGINRDSERASVIAYLASYSPDAPPAPEPLPPVEEVSDAVVEEAAETVEDAGAVVQEAVLEEAEGALAETDAVVTDVSETVEETMDDAVETVTEPAE
ncbi:MAG: c-type cytochrome [Pseudomonadota bacterium]